MKELSLFTGMGGGIYGSLILGWQTVAYVEKDEYCQKVIAKRIEDGWFDKGEIYGDIKDFNKEHASKYAGQIDVLTGGFPCQPFSVAGKRKGTSDERYLFDEIIKTIKIIRPKRLFFENVPGLLNDPAIIEIYKKLERLGYECKPPLLLGSDDCGNIHRRKRVWIYAVKQQQTDVIADPAISRCSTGGDNREKRQICKNIKRNTTENQSERHEWQFGINEDVSIHATDTDGKRTKGGEPQTLQGQRTLSRRENIGGLEDLLRRSDIPPPLFCGMDDELSDWRKQLKAVGNGQDPIVMATAYKLLAGEV